MKKYLKIFFFIVIIVLIYIFINKKQINSIEENQNINSEWILTQFGDNVGAQMMSFTIEGNKEGLVIIDGGYKDNEDQYNFLIEKIQKHNNIVDAWIITHFDSDHGGEFVRIAQLGNIKIKNVYVPDIPTDIEILKEKNPCEDDWSIYKEYLNFDFFQKVKVHSKDIFELIDLKMEVFSSYENWIEKKIGIKLNNETLLNNGSIVFKIYGNKESLLFCGDVQDNIIGEYLINNYKNKLKSDYLQVAHHGNNWLGEEFYRLVSPKVAIFPAPDWLIENSGNISWFTVEKNRKILEELGSKILWHNTSPNILVFK